MLLAVLLGCGPPPLESQNSALADLQQSILQAEEKLSVLTARIESIETHLEGELQLVEEREITPQELTDAIEAEKNRIRKHIRSILLRIVDRLDSDEAKRLEEIAPLVAAGEASTFELALFGRLTSGVFSELVVDRMLKSDDDKFLAFVGWLESEKKGASATYSRLDSKGQRRARGIHRHILEGKELEWFEARSLENWFGRLPYTNKYYEEKPPRRKKLFDQLMALADTEVLRDATASSQE